MITIEKILETINAEPLIIKYATIMPTVRNSSDGKPCYILICLRINKNVFNKFIAKFVKKYYDILDEGIFYHSKSEPKIRLFFKEYNPTTA